MLGAFLDERTRRRHVRLGQPGAAGGATLGARRVGGTGFSAAPSPPIRPAGSSPDRWGRSPRTRTQENTILSRSVRRWIIPSAREILDRDRRLAPRVKTVLEMLGGERRALARSRASSPATRAGTWCEMPSNWPPRWVTRRWPIIAAGLLGHADVRVRREDVRALGRLNSQGALSRPHPGVIRPRDPASGLAANAVGRKGRSEQVGLATEPDRGSAASSPCRPRRWRRFSGPTRSW